MYLCINKNARLNNNRVFIIRQWPMSWYIRPNPEDRINRKPDDWIYDWRAKDRINRKPSCGFSYIPDLSSFFIQHILAQFVNKNSLSEYYLKNIHCWIHFLTSNPAPICFLFSKKCYYLVNCTEENLRYDYIEHYKKFPSLLESV